MGDEEFAPNEGRTTRGLDFDHPPPMAVTFRRFVAYEPPGNVLQVAIPGAVEELVWSRDLAHLLRILGVPDDERPIAVFDEPHVHRHVTERELHLAPNDLGDSRHFGSKVGARWLEGKPLDFGLAAEGREEREQDRKPRAIQGVTWKIMKFWRSRKSYSRVNV